MNFEPFGSTANRLLEHHIYKALTYAICRIKNMEVTDTGDACQGEYIDVRLMLVAELKNLASQNADVKHSDIVSLTLSFHR